MLKKYRISPSSLSTLIKSREKNLSYKKKIMAPLEHTENKSREWIMRKQTKHHTNDLLRVQKRDLLSTV
jgi:hypothetical protein